MQSLFEKLASNLVFAALIPSAFFVIILEIILTTILPPAFPNTLKSIFGQKETLTVVLTILISFTLFYGRELLYSLYRGMYLPKKLCKFEMNYLERKRAERTKSELGQFKECLNSTRNPGQDANELEDRLYSLNAAMVTNFPCCYLYDYEADKVTLDEGEIMPTQLGNILRSAEYSCKRYGIDSVTLWPRLLHVIPEKSYALIEEVNNQMFLVINFSFLSFILAVLCGGIAIFQAFQAGPPVPYLIICITGAVFSIIFYKLALPLARNYAQMYCGAFDLYRLRLLEHLGYPKPENSQDEMLLWVKLSQSLTVNELEGPLYYDYDVEKKPATPSANSKPIYRSGLARVLNRMADRVEHWLAEETEEAK